MSEAEFTAREGSAVEQAFAEHLPMRPERAASECLRLAALQLAGAVAHVGSARFALQATPLTDPTRPFAEHMAASLEAIGQGLQGLLEELDMRGVR